MKLHSWRTIHWWIGTDAFRLDSFPPDLWYKVFRVLFERLIWKLVEPVTNEHWISHEILRPHLLAFGIDNRKIKVVPVESDIPKTVKHPTREAHNGFNILYYYPDTKKHKGGSDKRNRWTYGVDIIENLMNEFADRPGINWVRADGSLDMTKILPTIDIYLRPNRQEGCRSRMVVECEHYGIPYKWTMFEPEKENWMQFIDEQYHIWIEMERLKQGHG